jgi:glycosyltransferase involved in cell wall biosynthesis
VIVYLLAPDLRTLGGFEVQLRALSTGLARAGHTILVFVREPVRPDHPYRLEMERAGVRFSAPPRWLAACLRPSPAVGRAARRLLAMAALPALALLVLVKAVVAKRGLRRTWAIGRSRLGWELDRRLTRDGLTWWMERRLDRALEREPPDVIDVQHSMLPAAIRYGRRRGRATIYTEHGAPSAEFAAVWAGLCPVVNDADFVVGRSQASLDGLRELCGASRPAAVVPNAVMAAPSALQLTEPPAGAGEIVVTAVGRLSPEKGHAYLLAAFRKLLEAGLAVRLVLAGDGPLREELRAQAAAWGLTERMTVVGAFADIAPIIGPTHIVAHPTLVDGRSVAVLEAMAWGRPVVASRTGGLPELIEDGVNGLLVPPRDPDALAQALCRLATDEEERRRMGRAGRARFLAGNFTAEGLTAATLEVYRQVLGERGPAAARPG